MSSNDLMPDGEHSEVIVKWLTPLKRKRTNYNNLVRFSEWLGMSIDEIYEKRKEDMKSDDDEVKRFFETKLKEYVHYLRIDQGKRLNTQKAYATSFMSFCSSFYSALQYRRKELKFEEPSDMKTKTLKPIPTLEEVRAIFSVANPRDKPFLLLLAQTGMSPADIVSLRIEGLGLYENGELKTQTTVAIKERSKGAQFIQYIVISDEVLYYLEPLLKERGYPKEGFLLETQKGNPFDTQYMRERFNILVVRALNEEARLRYSPKTFRDFFHNALKMAEVENDMQNALMGWSRKGARNSYHLTEAVVLQAYNKAKPYISLNGGGRTEEEITRLKTTVGELAVQWGLDKKELTDRLTQLEEQNAELVKTTRQFIGLWNNSVDGKMFMKALEEFQKQNP